MSKLNPPAGGQNYNLKYKIFIALILILLGVFFRTIGHVAPNVEYVTTASLLAAAYLGGAWAIFVPLTIMVITDTLIGNTNIFIFTWSAYVIIGILGYYEIRILGKKLKIENLKSKILNVTGLGIVASLWFYLWTNFGVWLLDSWGMYARDLSGLLQCYIMGLPFLKLNLLGNLFFIPVSFGIVEGVKALRATKTWHFNFVLWR